MNVAIRERMNNPLLKALATLIAATMLLTSGYAQSLAAINSPPVQPELVSKYRKTTLFDVSADGVVILVYGASTPKNKKSGGVTVWSPKQGDKTFDMLRVVEWASGRELGKLHAHTVPSAARFTEGGNRVCYREGTENRLWDYATGQISTCSAEPKRTAYRGSSQTYDSPDGRFVAEPSKETVREVFLLTYVRGVVTVSDRNTGEPYATVVHPTVREAYDWPLTGYVYSVAFTPDNQHLITSYESDTYVWRLKPLIRN